MAVADRYLRTGTPVPVIYPGTVAMLTRAISDAERHSRAVPGPHVLSALYGRERVVLRVYEAGALTWVISRHKD